MALVSFELFESDPALEAEWDRLMDERMEAAADAHFAAMAYMVQDHDAHVTAAHNYVAAINHEEHVWMYRLNECW